MESLLFRVVHVILGIAFMYFVGFGCLAQALFSGEVGRFDSKFDSTGLASGASHYFEEYVAEYYFEKHDSLTDSDFQDFIMHKLSLGSCEVLQDRFKLKPRLSVLHRDLIGEGSHRLLSSSIRFQTQLVSMSELPAHFCEAIIVERLPSGVFADPFELQHLLQRGVFTDAAVFGDTNLELPSFQSNRSIVEVHMDIGSSMFLEGRRDLEINVEVPLHARYPPLGDRGFTRVEFGAPNIFIRCSIEAGSHNQSCLFLSTDESAESKAVTLGWEVPSGIKEHAEVVSAVTFVSAIVSALVIVSTCIYYSDGMG